MATVNLNQSATATLNGSGTGTSTAIGPIGQGETWTVTLISVKASTNVNESICSVFLGSSLVGSTTWGSTGDSDTGISLTVAGGQTLYATWTGGDSGAIGTLTVMGVRNL